MSSKPNTNLPTPIIVQMDYNPSSIAYFEAISHMPSCVWLDSGRPKCTTARFDILSAQPEKTFIHSHEKCAKTFINKLNNYLQKKSTGLNLQSFNTKDIPFVGGYIGYFNYEFNHRIFGINPTDETKKSKTAEIGFFNWAFIQDHKKQTSYCVFPPYWSKQKQQHIVNTLRTTKTETHKNPAINTPWAATQTHAFYQKNIAKIKAYIQSGDIYQANYSQQFSSEFKGEPSDAYLTLRDTIPSPYCAYLNFSETTVLSVSPEKFIGITPNNNSYQAVTKPIKGTQKRCADTENDNALAKELLESKKNQSENLMIVDLLRNDFSKNCMPNTVKVPHLFSLESYKNVHHLVSTVTGTLKENTHPLDFFLDCFPGGSITGAPKKRAMEIIDELEPHNRDIYCGSTFYQSLHGTLDSSITIRTMQLDKKSQKLHCWGGGGIVNDSICEDEYAESLAKINSLMQSLEN